MEGNVLASAALFGWIPLVVVLFLLLPRTRAVVWSFVLGWAFLPTASLSLPGIPDFSKVTATSLGIALAAVLFDFARVAKFRPRWCDVPMAVFCFCPFASSLSNGLGAYDGLSAVIDSVVGWGLPYLIGRLYFTDARALRELAFGMVGGALLYVPLCWFEIRFSPQLSNWIYGIEPSRFAQHARGSTWRPIVFMDHGLMVGLWMTAGSLMAFWLWRTRSAKAFWGIPASWTFALLAGTTLLCKSYGAIVLLMVGGAALVLSSRTRTAWAVALLLAAAPTYVVVRAQAWGKEPLVAWAAEAFNEDRVQSLEFRLDNEELLVDKAWERPLLGWGGWGRSHVYDENGRDITITDGLWIIIFGERGLLGLAALCGVFLLPLVLLLRRVPPSCWRHRSIAPYLSLCTLLTVAMIDNCLNAMVNPVFLVGVGATSVFPTLARRVAVRTTREPEEEDEAPDSGDYVVILPQ